MPVLEFSKTQLARKVTGFLRWCACFCRCVRGKIAARLHHLLRSEETRRSGGDHTRALARLWEDVDERPITESEVQANISACMDLIPPDDDVSLGPESDYAENAVVALVYALTCRQNGDSQEAVWSAEQAYNALDHFVINRENVDLNALGAERRIVADPLIQAELSRQLRDIDELLRVGDEDVRQVAARFRDRAKADSKIFFGVPS